MRSFTRTRGPGDDRSHAGRAQQAPLVAPAAEAEELAITRPDGPLEMKWQLIVRWLDGAATAGRNYNSDARDCLRQRAETGIR